MEASQVPQLRKPVRGAVLGFIAGNAAAFLVIAAIACGYWLGLQDRSDKNIEVLQAATSATGTNMAVATGAVSDDAEGIFFLDFLTGDLQCLVYYPRTGAFGARFYTNVLTQLPGAGKNSQYLLVTGVASTGRAGVGGAKPGNSLVYVTDTISGNFAAYSIPWDRTAEGSARPQSGPLLFVGGGPVRNYQIRSNSAPAQISLPPQGVLDAKKTPADAKKPADKQKPGRGKQDKPKPADKPPIEANQLP